MAKSKWQELKELVKNPSWREFINFIDDPWDDLKHKINGMKIFGYTIRIPMRGSGNPDK